MFSKVPFKSGGTTVNSVNTSAVSRRTGGFRFSDYDHTAASVALNSCPGGTYYLKDGFYYYYCESTSDTKNVGEFWDKYDRAEVLIIW